MLNKWGIFMYVAGNDNVQGHWLTLHEHKDDNWIDEIDENRIPAPDENIELLHEDYYMQDKFEAAFKKRVRHICDHNELHEFHHEDTCKMFDVDFEILDRL